MKKHEMLLFALLATSPVFAHAGGLGAFLDQVKAAVPAISEPQLGTATFEGPDGAKASCTEVGKFARGELDSQEVVFNVKKSDWTDNLVGFMSSKADQCYQQLQYDYQTQHHLTGAVQDKLMNEQKMATSKMRDIQEAKRGAIAAEKARQAEIKKQEAAQEAAKQEAAKQEVAKQEAAKQEAARQAEAKKLAKKHRASNGAVAANQPANPQSNASGSSYKTVDLLDLKVDMKVMANKKVSVTGVLGMIGDLVYLGTEEADMSSVSVNIEKLPREDRKRMMKDCTGYCDDVKINGTIRKDVLDTYEIVAEQIVWP